MNDVEVITEEKKPRTPKELTLFILKIVGNVVFYAVVIFLLLFSIMNINGGSQKEGTSTFPNIFGRGFLVPISDSMDATPKKEYVYADKDYKIGCFKQQEDLLNVKVFNQNDFESLKVGDVITFYDSELNSGKGGLNTHRIIEINLEDQFVVTQGDKRAQQMKDDGMISFIDAGKLEDKEKANNIQYNYQARGYIEVVRIDQIKAIVTSVNYGGGTFQLWIRNNWLWIFVLPVALFLLFEIFMVVKNIMDLRGAKQKAELALDKEAMMADLEKEKEAMRAQILAELRAAQGLPDKAPITETENVETIDNVEVKEEAPVEVASTEDDHINEEPVVEEVETEVAEESPKKAPVKKTTTKKTTKSSTTATKKEEA